MPSEERSADPPVVLDIRVNEETNHNVRQELLAGLKAPVGKKAIPTVVLYDSQGLRIYDKITTDAAEDYYLFPCEEEILKNHSKELVQLLHSPTVKGGTKYAASPIAGEVLIELGAGALRKTSHILQALADAVQPDAISNECPPITYYALDLERKELVRTLKLTQSHLGDVLKGKVAAKGMLGTYDDGIKFVREGRLDESRSLSNRSSDEKLAALASDDCIVPDVPLSEDGNKTPSLTPPSSGTSTPPQDISQDAPLFFMFLGSSLGNFPPKEASAFLKSLPLRPGSQDKLLLGLDHANGKDLIEVAYNDRKGITKDFIMNGLKGAGRLLGNESMFDIEGGRWDYVNHYNESEHRHEAYYRSKIQQQVQFEDTGSQNPVKVTFAKDELIHVEYSHKFSSEDTTKLFSEANLRPIYRWTDSRGLYSLWLLERPPFDFPLVPAVSSNRPGSRSNFGAPTLLDFQELWKLWDMITLEMIPKSMLHAKPIDLRHKCLFYLGHIPAFLDIHLSRFLQEPHTKPESYKHIFERGIDPNVDDPTQCHSHSEVPTNDEDWPTLEEILAFRDRVRERLSNLYREYATGTRSMNRRAGRVLAMTFEHEQMHAETLLYMLLQVADGSPTSCCPPSGFTIPQWDLLAKQEKTAHADFVSCNTFATVKLGPAKITLGHQDLDKDDHLPLTAEHSYGWDNESPPRAVEVSEFRIEWRPVSNGQFYEFLNGPQGDDIRNRELPPSWVQIGDDIFVRTLYGPVPLQTAYHWPVVTSYDDLSTYARVQGGRIPTEPELRLFLDTFCSGYLGGGNIGFRNWHPVAPTTGTEDDGGRGHNGGVWEWTSTVLEKYEGYSPSELYPGYSSDFFDTHHHVVLGGSYATPPRLAQRSTFRNWYQHNYPYAWIGARIAYDN